MSTTTTIVIGRLPDILVQQINECLKVSLDLP
jgi:hypothetical protein